MGVRASRATDGGNPQGTAAAVPPTSNSRPASKQKANEDAANRAVFGFVAAARTGAFRAAPDMECHVERLGNVQFKCGVDHRAELVTSAAVATVCGWRKSNEDAHAYAAFALQRPALGARPPQSAIVQAFAIFDGHGGAEAAQAARGCLTDILHDYHDAMAETFLGCGGTVPAANAPCSNQREEGPPLAADWMHRLFLDLDNEVLAALPAGSRAGATAVVVVVCKATGVAICAHAGDSMALLIDRPDSDTAGDCDDECNASRGDIPLRHRRLTASLHSPNDPTEAARITGDGAYVEPTIGCGLDASAVLDLDNEVLAALPAGSRAGATAVVVVVCKATGVAICAHAGDSMALLVDRPDSDNVRDGDDEGTASRGDVPLHHRRLTASLHSPNDPTEAARITGDGAYVENGRVLGRLAVARALGDRSFKLGGSSKESAVTAWPDVVAFRIIPNRSTIVMGCDGVFELQSESEVAAIAVSNGDAAVSARAVVERAIAPIGGTGPIPGGPGFDNATCCVIHV
eukprot:CAMPEP_0174879384 /NCGR_PEP_ID=MMETSP1114-20130205/83235_1 /TAXON_ID=312471 /ORGANISM="Neobodo designis, Strain CCAP 1951/1" /LENGTH=517 /DNA_ID=CAMNT_0016114777 /DNA_START=71 /DNA_END=1625 /DNA_ORIENTATION=+